MIKKKENKMDTSFEIPVDGAIERFHEHLNTHDRTILSAKFGDGKSYFLQKFISDKAVKDDYVFLTLYPVNYQVEENKDVFELIKYDLLIQLFVRGLMKPDFKMSKLHAFGWCLQLNAPTLVEGLLPIFSCLYLDEASAKMMAAFLTAQKSVGKIRKKAKELMEPVRDKQIDNFLKEIAKNPVSGQDVVTEIIQQGISTYKNEHPDKKIVLIIEDMDRMDPAHLFRILNVFSAHIDYNYRFGVNPNQPFIGNKFGLDKVVFVMSYENTEQIFHHFYGKEAEFNGYISKFCSSNSFTYSFADERDSYLYNRMAVNTQVDPFTLKFLVSPDDFEVHSIREIVNAVENVDNFIVKPIVLDGYSKYKSTDVHVGILKVIAILRKLNMKNDKIKDRLNNCMANEECYKQLFGYLACLLLYAKRNAILGRMKYRSQFGNEDSVFEVQRLDNQGKAICSFYYERQTINGNNVDISQVLDRILEMVAP